MIFTSFKFVIEQMREKNLWQWKMYDPIQKSQIALNRTEFDSTRAVDELIRCYENSQGNYVILKVNQDARIQQDKSDNEQTKSEWATFYVYLGESVRPETVGTVNNQKMYYPVQDSEAKAENERLKRQLESIQETIQQDKVNALHEKIKELESKVKELQTLVDNYEAELQEEEEEPSPINKLINGIMNNDQVVQAIAGKLLGFLEPENNNTVKLKQVAGVQEQAGEDKKGRGRPKKLDLTQFEAVLKRLYAIDSELIDTLEIVAKYAEKDKNAYMNFKNTLKTLAQ